MSQAIATDRCVLRDTGARKGRTRSLEPGRTAARHLHFGRIILDPGDDAVRFPSQGHETVLLALKGKARVAVGDSSFDVGRYDALYVPRDSQVEVRPSAEGCDLAEMSAPVTGSYPLQFVSWAEVQKDTGLHFKTGAAASERVVNVLVGKNVQAGRLMAGVTFSTPGNWTSWPPHEHAALAEEAYLYIDMPAPAFGIQLVYTNPREPELAVLVREGDCVLMPEGYHPNVGAPGGSINFLWMMAAVREVEDRKFGVVNVQPDFASIRSGLETGR
jgi:5-deoxy-glucuronate isomerase